MAPNRATQHILYKIPQITEAITVDQKLHVKLFSSSSPLLVPEWFHKGSDCRLKRE